MNTPAALSRPANADAPGLEALRASGPGPGDPVEAPEYAFVFRELEPVPPVTRRLLVALHGADGDEFQFADALAGLRPGDAVVLARAPRSLPGGRLGWFRESVADGDARADPAEFDDSLGRLVAFVGQQQRRHAIAPADTVLVGFSQGGALALSAAVTEGGLCGAVAVLGGRLPRRVEPQVELPQGLAGLDVLLLHAPDDDVLAPDLAEGAEAFLVAQDLAPTLRLTGHGHALTATMVAELRRWLQEHAPSVSAGRR